jgi:glyoxylase-like metal-dependent hydrolase (beta-lactamase superfamily II)
MTTTHLICAALLVAAAGCEGDQGPPGPEGPPGGVDPTAPALDKAYAALGGKDAVAALAGFVVEASGERLMTLEGFRPEDDAVSIGTFRSLTSADVAGERLRVEYHRDIPVFGAKRDYAVIVNRDLAAIDGIESVFNVPGGALPSDRWASTLRLHALLHPQLLLRDVARGARTATDAGVALRDGELRQRIELTDGVRPISLFIDRHTGELTELATFENELVTGDAELGVHYANWRTSDGGVAFPEDVVIAVGGQPVHAEHRDRVALAPALADSLFAFAAGVTPTHVAADAARGARNSQFLEGFGGLGVPLEGLQTEVVAQQLAPGVWHLRGGTHHSLVVEQTAGVVVIEAPLYEARAQAVLAWITATIPGKPVTHVALTHHHRDHAGALRTFVARGAKVVAGEAARPLFSRAVRAARTIEPDELAVAPRSATILTVPAGGQLTLPDATRPVRLVAVDSTHAADMVVAYAPTQRVLFVSDIFSPGFPPNPPGAREVLAAIGASPIDAIAGGHGGVGTRAELEAAAGN